MPPSLEDRFAIQDLLFRYAKAADDRDADVYAGCFLGGQVHVSGPGFESRDARQNMATLQAMFEWTMHKVHNHEYSVDGDVARGYCYCVATHVRREGQKKVRLDWHIRYEDELAREQGQWRFVKRHLHVGLMETLPLSE